MAQTNSVRPPIRGKYGSLADHDQENSNSHSVRKSFSRSFLRRKPAKMAVEEMYGISRYQLMELMAQRRMDAVNLINEHGGPKSIAQHLKTDLKSGISCRPGEMESRVSTFGANYIPPSPPKAFLSLCLDALQDKTLIILIGAAIISIVLGVTVEHDKVSW
jgi:magnesium-transporting ATPase (P-type)